MASMSRYAEEDSNRYYFQLCCSVPFSTRPKIVFGHIKIKGNGGFFFQMRNNKKTAILVKEVNTKKRLFLVHRPNTGRQLKLETYADIKKRFKKVMNQEFHQKCCKGAAWSKFFTFLTVRSCQKMPSSTGRTSTNPRHRFVLMRIGRCSFRSLTYVYFEHSIYVCNSRVTHTNPHELGLNVLSSFLSLDSCSLLFRRGNCKKVSVGLQCEVGLRCRTYFVLCGSVLSVWNEVELVLAPVSGANVKVQIVRLRTEDGQRIVGEV